MIRTAENLRCRMRLGTVSLGFDNLCQYLAPRPKREWKLKLTRLGIGRGGGEEEKKRNICI
jgi:hypothetical protein